MRYLFLSLLSFVFVFSSSLVLASGLDSDFAFSLGKRLDSLDWNIDGGAGGPNILSELEWRDLDIVQLRGEYTGSNAAGAYFRGSASYGWVLDGVNQDSDYAGNNRTLEFSRSINDVDGSRVRDISGGLGFAFRMGEADQYQIIPMVGLSYHNQDLRMVNGNQRVSDLANWQIFDPSVTAVAPLGPFPGLHSSYDAEWSGFWLGADVLLDLQDGSSVFVRLENHWIDYFAQANWNLRSDFAHPVSFEHEANGRGWVMELGWSGPVSQYSWVWGVAVSLQSWTTDAGIDRTYFSNNTFFEGGLSEVNWSSRSINITLKKAFEN